VAAANAPVGASDPAAANVAPAVRGTTTASVATGAAAPSQNTVSANKSLEISREKRSFGGLLTPYRVDIQQGNFVTQEMVNQLKPGMTIEQVRFVLGTPLLTDVFHADRWDYVFDLKRSNGEITRGRLSVYFKDQRLERWEGGDLPNEQDYLARISTGKEPVKKNAADAAPASPVAPSVTKEPK
jgi:outer membrane protein assembly factor BamE